MRSLDVLVIGAGQAGLAMGHTLRDTALGFLLVDAHPRLGDAWRNRYDSLVLFTPRSYSALPGVALPGDPEGYPTKDELADYLEAYGRSLRLPVRTGTRIASLRQENGGFRAETGDGSVLRSRAVVLANGAFQTPSVPRLARDLDPGVVQLSAADYRSPHGLPEGNIVVVGDGATGRQVALELAPVRPTFLAAGRTRRVSPERVLGRSVFWWMDRTGLLRASRGSRVGRRLMEADPFPGKHLERARLERRGVTLLPRVVSARGDRVVAAGGRELAAAAVIWATGYREETGWLEIPDAKHDDGSLIHDRGITPVRGLYLLGRSWQWTRGSALLLGVADDACFLLEHMKGVLDMDGHGAVTAHGGKGGSHSGATWTGDHTPLVATPGREVVVELRAEPGRWEIGGGHGAVDGWMYNGMVPGPVIEAHAGDVLVARLTNRLPEPTTIHWHGLRLPPAMDGTDDVQRPVAPGETFEYRFPLPDAGTFWYHPHANETVQLERGLYGVLVVRGNDDPVVDGDRVLVFDDVRLDRRGRIARPGRFLEKHNGREGKTLLLNGRVGAELALAAGQVERWRLVNVASARYVRFSLGGAPFRIIASDGGLIEGPVETTEALMTPADRLDVLVGPFVEGTTLRVESLPYDRGLGLRKWPDVFGTVRVGPVRPSVAAIGDRLRTIQPLAGPGVASNREVRLGGRMSARNFVEFMVNDEAHHHGAPVEVGELQIWDVINETPIDHPFHLHGFFFQVLDVNGDPPAYASWEDTVNVPRKGRVRIAWLPDDRPGPWMAHCHILEHHAAGMMTHFHVVR
jgi:FtsP/CotA-like multicopper oxidase with cupredoxin domain/cation diffusion facilitator CzcD-associated flavoprotein CzcO